ncbi:alpha/beta hydrolase family protein [Cohnella sp. GCM10027633]|uniref:alpha/beta hydrolase family protein n=1 Tax=unclassified Cohnella TaxID=2636738 RepID=UPI003637D91F
MANRHFSMTEYWNEKAKEWVPLSSFQGETKEDWEAWRTAATERFKSLLGPFPDKVDLAAEVEYVVEDGDLIRERVIFDSEAFASVPCVVLRPRHMKPDRSNAAIICCNGHPVDLGKDPVAGVRSSPEHDKQIALMNYNYGEQMARAGFFVIVPELRGFGERNDTHCKTDACNLNYIKGSIFGVYPQTLNIWDIKCTIDYLETRAEVDPERIGMMGLSYGGTMTTLTTAIEPRIKAADVMSYINPFSGFGVARGNFCGSQMVPEIYKYFDTHDIAGLIAPRPLLVEMGIYDDCFYIEDLLKGYDGVKRIYNAADAASQLEEDTHAGPHAFAGNKAFEFFRKHL